MNPRHQPSPLVRRAGLVLLLGAAFCISAAHAQAPGLAAPQLVLKENVLQMPKGDTQEVRVMTAAFKPGDKTVFHTHRSPVTVYVLEGQFTLNLEGRAPVVLSAGQAFVLRGVDLAGYDMIMVGASVYPATPTADGGLSATIPLADPIAAGAYPVCVARTLPDGHTLSSNAVAGHLVPRVTSVNLPVPLTLVAGKLFGQFVVNGAQLGGPDAAIYAALYLNGKAQLLLEPLPGGSATSLTFAVSDVQALAPNPNYRVILRVNGEQALDSPALSWT